MKCIPNSPAGLKTFLTEVDTMENKYSYSDSAIVAEVDLINDLVTISLKARCLNFIKKTANAGPRLLNRIRTKKETGRVPVEKLRWISHYGHLKFKTRLI